MTIIQADALNMPLADCSVDAVVTDPPYGLEFMGKEWDRLLAKDRHVDYASCRNAHGPNEYKAGLEAQLWHSQWLTEAYRVLKPGGSMLVMGGTRTFHRLMCAIEDTGFIIKDVLMYVYGSGFPKAQDLGKMIDKRGRAYLFFNEIRELLKYYLEKSGKSLKEINQIFDFAITGSGMAGHWFANITQQTLPTKFQWLKLKDILNIPDNKFDEIYQEIELDKRPIIGKDKNWGKVSGSLGIGGKEWNITLPYSDLAKYWDGFKIGGIKPAYEPIVWAVKPPEGSYVDNVLKWNVGAVNVDATRINVDNDEPNKRSNPSNSPNTIWNSPHTRGATLTKGRFPANLILDEESAKVLDEQSGDIKSGGGIKNPKDGKKSTFRASTWADGIYSNPSNGGASRFFYCAKASRTERNAGLDGMEETRPKNLDASGKGWGITYPDGSERPRNSIKNNHPTVKPIALFEWLIKLVTREGQTVLDPFLGSGTTAISAHNTERKCIGIEKEGEYVEIAKRRVDYWESQPKQMEMRA